MEYLLKASAVIALFYLCFYFFLKKETFFERNRWFLLIGLVIALVFPFIVIPIYIPIESHSIIETSNVVYETVANTTLTTQTESVFEWTSLIPIIYSLGLSTLFIQFILQFGSLILLLIHNPKNKDGIYTYVIVKNKISPFSFFKWIVYNPENYDTEELQLILIHEKVHASQMHSIDILFTQLACVIFWFNPLVWLYRKEVRQNLEYIADFQTQNISKNEQEYQRLLLKTSLVNHNISISNNFYNSLIKERIIMLKKSRSNTKKQWKYLLMLPLLAGLLMSVNTEKVYVEKDISTLNSEKTIELIVNKNTTDTELKAMSNTIESKGGNLVFSQIKRNNANELTSIFLKLNNYSYGGDFGRPIDAFIIYKELYGLGGGYVNRIDGATLHYDNNVKFYDEKNSQELAKRAHKAIINAGIQNKEDLQQNKKIRSDYKKAKLNKKTQPLKSVKQVLPKKSKTIAMVTPKKIEKESAIVGNISITVINKNTTDAELDNIKESLKEEGLTARFKGVRRNNNGEITAIKIEVKSKKSNASYNVNSDEAIDPVKIVYDEDKNSISIGNSNARHSQNIFAFESRDGNHQIQTSGSGSHVYVISDDKHKEGKGHDHEEGEGHDHESKIYVMRKGKKGKVKRVKRSNNVEVISGGDNEVIEIIIDEDDDNNNKETFIVNGKKVTVAERQENTVFKGKGKNVWVTNTNDKDDNFLIEIDDSNKNIFISGDNGKNPLFILDGKEITKEQMAEVKPNKIESVTVLKDKSAVAKYGEKAKDGVVIIKTKKKN